MATVAEPMMRSSALSWAMDLSLASSWRLRRRIKKVERKGMRRIRTTRLAAAPREVIYEACCD